MKILIIGGTGNISTGITKRLMGQGHDLTLFNHDPQPPAWLQDARVVSGNRKDFPAFEQKVASLGEFDCVIDMLCFEPSEAESDIRAFRGKTRQFILCSTVDVYTKTPSRFPVAEEGEIAPRPSFAYGYNKALCERLLWAAQARGDFALTVLRPTFTYNETWSPGIHAFGGQTYHLDRLRQGKPIILHGDGASIWTATYRDDTASAFAGAVGNPAAFGQAFNVTGDEWMTHHHIWRTIARAMGAPEPDFVYIPTAVLGKIAPKQAEWCVENFQYNNIFDNSKAKRVLNYRYTVPFEEGVRRCLDYLNANNLIESSDNHPFYDRIVEAWRKQEEALASEFKTNPL
jgi:nucleoside-diphosphate-sugar epimerase